MADTSGFYKEDDGAAVLYAASEVAHAQYTLKRALKDTYNYPVNGWYWFNSEEEAYAAFDVPYPPINDEGESWRLVRTVLRTFLQNRGVLTPAVSRGLDKIIKKLYLNFDLTKKDNG